MHDAETRRLVRDLEACALAPGTFHHEQHVRVAWAMLAEEGLTGTLARFPRALRRFAAHVGAHGLYHETVTWAFLFLIHERRQRLPERHGWQHFARHNAELLAGYRATLARYYSPERLDSPLARVAFVMPDRAPLGAGVVETEERTP